MKGAKDRFRKLFSKWVIKQSEMCERSTRVTVAHLHNGDDELGTERLLNQVMVPITDDEVQGGLVSCLCGNITAGSVISSTFLNYFLI